MAPGGAALGSAQGERRKVLGEGVGGRGIVVEGEASRAISPPFGGGGSAAPVELIQGTVTGRTSQI
jgi:hypothetical protein